MRLIRIRLSVCVTFVTMMALGTAEWPQAATTATTTQLPLRRIIHYKSGIGHFEHAGAVTGNQQVEIDLTGAQLDDLLQSLVARDLNGGRIVRAAYNSGDSLTRQTAALRLPQ